MKLASIVFWLLAALPAFARTRGQEQPSRPPQVPPGKPAGASEWSFEGQARADFRYDSNVWLLDRTPADKLDQGLPSGRYEDMESVDDLILTPEVRLGARGGGLLGRRLRAGIDLEYPLFLENPKKSHLEAALRVEQGIGPDGRLGLALKFIPEYFRRNYLADAVDPANDGVSADERRYAPGDYREWELRLDYRHALVKKTKESPYGLDGTVELGWLERTYDSPFEGRDKEGPVFKLGLKYEADTSFGVEAYYEYEAMDSGTRPEVLLLDEPDFGVNFNGDLDSTDNNARAVQRVDRTYVSHGFGVRLFFGNVVLKYSRSLREFQSDERFDVGHNGRDDTRQDFGFAVKFDVGKDWDGRFELLYRQQDTDRPSDPNRSGEEVDYRKVVVALSFTFNW